MEIFAFDLSDKWIDLEGGYRVKVDYLTPDQKYKLKSMQFKGIDFKFDRDEEGLPIFDNLTTEQFSKINAISKLFAETYLKYAIKDWSGIKDGRGNEVPCVLVNDELENNLWRALCSREDLVDLLFEKTYNGILRWNATDKKKLRSRADSKSKVG